MPYVAEFSIAFDIMDALIHRCFSGFMFGFIEFARDPMTYGSISYTISQHHLGMISMMEIQKLDAHKTLLFVSDVSDPTDDEVLTWQEQQILVSGTLFAQQLRQKLDNTPNTPLRTLMLFEGVPIEKFIYGRHPKTQEVGWYLDIHDNEVLYQAMTASKYKLKEARQELRHQRQTYWHQVLDAFNTRVQNDGIFQYHQTRHRSTHRIMSVIHASAPLHIILSILTEFLECSSFHYQRVPLDGGVRYDLRGEHQQDAGEVHIRERTAIQTLIWVKSAAVQRDPQTMSEEDYEYQAAEQHTQLHDAIQLAVSTQLTYRLPELQQLEAEHNIQPVLPEPERGANAEEWVRYYFERKEHDPKITYKVVALKADLSANYLRQVGLRLKNQRAPNKPNKRPNKRSNKKI